MNNSMHLTNALRVMIHPASTKHIKLGHPWITEDSYTKRFAPSAFFLKAIDDKTKQDVGIFIHDPEHKNVKARLWLSPSPINESQYDFLIDLTARVETAILKRKKSQVLEERENFYLINAESDSLPGLLVLLLKNQIIIQYYALFWKKIESELILIIKEKMKEIFKEIKIEDIWIQERNFKQAKVIRSLSGLSQKEYSLKEFGLNYLIRLNQHYDMGLYTDMSANRKQLRPILQKSESFLNLFSYTGAFSVFALSLGVKKVVSVDLSEKYLKWLDENIALNAELNASLHQNLNMPCEKALLKLIDEKVEFEAIVCDPPSASSDGDAMTNALKSYEKMLPLLLEVTAANGKLIVFLNTHAISWNKFEEKLKQIISTTRFKDKAIVGKRYKLSEDCSPLKGFHEGDYLKGILIEFKNQIKE